MAEPSLFPKFMNPLGGATGGGLGGGDIIVELMADPDITLETNDITLDLEDENISVEVEEDISIEVEVG